MRLSTSTLVLGAASSAVRAQDQKALNGGGDAQSQASIELDSDTNSYDSWWAPIENIWGEATSEIKATWDEISLLIPGAFEGFEKQVLGNDPKTSNKRPESDYDYHVKGSDLESIMVETNGESHRKVEGDLSSYGLRVKAVDPSALGVDDVKQYSGYLDEYEEDKHLFYCKSISFCPRDTVADHTCRVL